MTTWIGIPPINFKAAPWNKWYQHTQKKILYHMEQEKLQVIHISEIFFSNTPKSRVAQPNITFTKDALLSMLRSHFVVSLFIHLD